MNHKITLLISVFLALTVANAYAGGAENHNAVVERLEVCPGYPGDTTRGDFNKGLTCYSVTGWSKGNRELNCTVIVPDDFQSMSVPLIAWANGWSQGNVNGQCTTKGYLPGLKQWSKTGFIVAAANQWSVQESDVLACAQWVADYKVPNPEDAVFNFNGKIGLVGHSQGGGAVIKAGNGRPGLDIAAVMTMNPYGPGWVRSENQDGPVFIVGGGADTTTPPDSYREVWDAIKAQVSPGGIYAIRADGTHNNDAWNGVPASSGTFPCEDPDPTKPSADKGNFGSYQDKGLLWWQGHLKSSMYPDAIGTLKSMLMNDPDWSIEFTTP
jgi:dienelactone hydrolase